MRKPQIHRHTQCFVRVGTPRKCRKNAKIAVENGGGHRNQKNRGSAITFFTKIAFPINFWLSSGSPKRARSGSWSWVPLRTGPLFLNLGALGAIFGLLGMHWGTCKTIVDDFCTPNGSESEKNGQNGYEILPLPALYPVRLALQLTFFSNICTGRTRGCRVESKRLRNLPLPAIYPDRLALQLTVFSNIYGKICTERTRGMILS